MKRKAKIVATLGPSSNNKKRISELIHAGIDVARLNFSHGTHESHGKIIQILNDLSADLGKQITILQDLQGPKLRIGKLPEAGIELSAGETVVFKVDSQERNNSFDISEGKNKIVYLDIPDILLSLKKGKKILIDDGKIELEIQAIH